jgi:glycosyltransferase involved in cell wall biosynthesis
MIEQYQNIDKPEEIVDAKPFFSVIICTFNRANLISRALDSLILQKFKNFEVIVVDDGSTDYTFNVVKKYREHLFLRYIFQTNLGLPEARNTGCCSADGNYITFLDSDDEYTNNHLQHRRMLLMQNPQVDLLHGGIEIIGEPFVRDANNSRKLVHINDCSVGGTFFFRRDLWKQVDKFSNIDYAEDYDFFQKVEKTGAKILKTNEQTYRYHRETPDSITNNIDVG